MSKKDQVEAVVMGLVVSYRRPMSVQQLDEEYRTVEGRSLTHVLRELGYGRPMPWYEDDNFWRDFGKLYQMHDGRIVANNGDDTLVNVITNTRIRNGNVGKIGQRWNHGGQLRDFINTQNETHPINDPAIVHLESTRINESTEREPHVIGDYCEYSTESPVSSQASDDELDVEEPVTIPTVEIESHSFRETLSRSSSLDTLADGETISVNEMYDDLDELDQQRKWNHVLLAMRVIDYMFQFPNGINLPSFKSQLWSKYPDSMGVFNEAFLKKARLRNKDIIYVRVESKVMGVIKIKKTKPKYSSQVIIQPYYFLHTNFNYSQAIYEATAKLVRDTFRRLMRMLRVFGHGIFEDQIEEMYEQIYNQKIADVSDLTLHDFMKCVRGFIPKQSPLDNRVYYQAMNFIFKVEDPVFRIEDDEPLANFIQASACERRRSLREMMLELRQTDHIAFITIDEVGARYSAHHRLPFLLHQLDTIHTVVTLDRSLMLREGYPIADKIKGIVHLVEETVPNPDTLVKQVRQSLDDGEHVAIGDCYYWGHVIVIRKSLYDGDVAELHRHMKQRYKANRAIDSIDIDDLRVCDNVAVQAGEYNEWYRAVVYRVNPDDSAVTVYCLDLGIEKTEPISSIRRLDREFVNFLPHASGITVKLSSQISDGTKKMIGQMMRIDNHFRVNVTEISAYNTVRFTHIATDFTFGGNITADMATNFRRKMNMLEQRRAADHCDVNLDTPSTPSCVSQFTRITHPLGHQVNISRTATNDRYDLTIDNESFDVSINHTNVCVKLVDVYRLVKKYESESEIKIRLLLRKAQNSKQLQPSGSDQYAITDIIEIMTKSGKPCRFTTILECIKSTCEEFIGCTTQVESVDISTNDIHASPVVSSDDDEDLFQDHSSIDNVSTTSSSSFASDYY